MKLRTQLTLIVGLTVVIGGATIGWATALVHRSQAVESIDAVLDEAIAVVQNDPTQDVSLILSFADLSAVPVAAELFYAEDEAISLVESRDEQAIIDFNKLSVDEVSRTVVSPITISGPHSYRVRSLLITEGEWFVVAASLDTVNSEFNQSLSTNALFFVCITLLIVAVVRWLIHRLLKPIAQITQTAIEIAEGNIDVALPDARGSTEVSQLTVSLNTMVASLRDAVTVTKKSEAKMREFLGDASHELRTPLTVIRGYIDILNTDQVLSEEQLTRAMSRLTSESERMSQTINDLLLLSEVGEIKPDQFESVDFSRITVNHLEDLLVRQPSRPVARQIEPGISVSGIHAHLSRMVSNLFSNIVAHTPIEARVAVSLKIEHDFVVLTVDDAGKGLSDEMYERDTTGFQRFDRAHSPTAGGFGLGLSIISSIVQRHGGKFQMSKSPFGGVRTVIRMPNLKVDLR